MKKILWLASWYPNRLDWLNGDFIERHAKAAALNNKISVLYVIKDDLNLIGSGSFIERRNYNDNLAATIVYYKPGFKKIKSLNRLLSGFCFLKYFMREADRYVSEEGKPNIIHVHVALTAGLVALFLKLKYKVPYVITEHWTGFCPEAKPNFADERPLIRWLWKIIMKHASGLTTVSAYLGESIKLKFNKLNYIVIPNVVDTRLFTPLPIKSKEPFQFLHVSTLTPQKNPEQILQGISILSSTSNRHFKVTIYGPGRPELQSLCRKLNIGHLVDFKKEVSQQSLVKDVQQGDALILYSRFETFGCVIIEANACGVPVVVSDIPVLHENVQNGITGVFVPLDRPELLAEKMRYMMDNNDKFDRAKIRDITLEKYSYQVIARKFDAFYDTILLKATT